LKTKKVQDLVKQSVLICQVEVNIFACHCTIRAGSGSQPKDPATEM
jgi:hypothetical protein